MSLAALASRHARAAVVAIGALVVAGALAAFSLPSSIYPALEFPRMVVIAHSGTLPPQAMTLSVTRPLEQAVMEVPGVRRVRSKTIRGAVEISAQFDPATDMLSALQQLQTRVTETRGELPADTELSVERLTPAVFPSLILSMTGRLSTADLHDYATYVVRPELARVAGVGPIDVIGSDSREIEVVLDPAKLTSTHLTVSEVADALKTENALRPVGQFSDAGLQHLVLASGLWTSIDDIANATVRMKGGARIRVADLGIVTPGVPDRHVLVTGNGRDAISIGISQQPGANILALKQGVDAALDRLRHTLPAGIEIATVYDLAEFVSGAVANVRDAILIGGVLAVIVLWVFLRDPRLTLIAAITLPLAVIPTFFFMRVLGESINLMSMGGLAVAIGLVIDDAVVVVEYVHRHALESGEGAIEGVAALWRPLISSTLTTVVVFLPLGLLSGVTGQFFRALSLTLSVAVIMSLVLSLTIVPVMARWALRAKPRAPSTSTSDSDSVNASASDGHQTDRLGRGYVKGLAVMVSHPRAAVLLAVVLAVSAGLLGAITGTGFLPPADEGGFVIDYLTPPGSALADTDRQVRALEAVIAATPEVASYSRRTGSELGLFATAQNSGDILVRLKPRRQRARSAEEIITDVRPKLQAAAPHVEIEFVQLLQDMLGDLEGAPTPVEVKIFGDDTDTLDTLAHQVETLLASVHGVVDIVGMQRGNPELTWRIDATEARRFGLGVDQVAGQLSDAWLGAMPTELHLLDRRVPVRVRLPDAFRFDLGRMGETLIKTADDALVPLSSMAKTERANGQAELLRENLRGMALVTARLEGRDLGSAVDEVRGRLDTIKLPLGYTYEIGGQYESQRQAFRELLLIVALAVLLVFTILVVQFRAWLPAALIMGAAPLSLAGALGLLWLTGTDLNVSSAMGLILLIGLTVKNGIMLLDVFDQRRAAGESFERAMVEAGRIRLTPILMTTCCTLLGLVPLALGLGAGAELQQPLALAVIGGLALSTPVTLLVLPGVYAAFATRHHAVT